MDRLWTWLSYCYILVTVTQAVPLEAAATHSMGHVIKVCHAKALGDVIKESVASLDSDDLNNDQYDNDILERLTNFIEQNSKIGVNNVPFEIDVHRNKLSDETIYIYRTSLKNCINGLLTKSAPVGIEESTDPYDEQTHMFPEYDINGVFSDSHDVINDVKRFKDRQSVALNPTGWRKRRSDRKRESEEGARAVIRNMQELLEKRQRLQFNPTGW
ncbi:uncharacterized protein LOC127836625 [Dreissena polymorpha]|uniref:Uncharacterized protein n=1 Tax=Dreissena polymorpha TaxID=45954 RepID=A0A9D4JGB7_DREPO|nr:uncharacterized protein LOC127836625 [Dreissena polymorpha]KAH3810830.1 hypothetical protein DPMN_139228 [Dreissena polymorpha]